MTKMTAQQFFDQTWNEWRDDVLDTEYLDPSDDMDANARSEIRAATFSLGAVCGVALVKGALELAGDAADGVLLDQILDALRDEFRIACGAEHRQDSVLASISLISPETFPGEPQIDETRAANPKDASPL